MIEWWMDYGFGIWVLGMIFYFPGALIKYFISVRASEKRTASRFVLATPLWPLIIAGLVVVGLGILIEDARK